MRAKAFGKARAGKADATSHPGYEQTSIDKRYHWWRPRSSKVCRRVAQWYEYMKQILVIVPFPMSKDNLALRKQQLDAVQMSEQMAFTFKAVKAAPKNYISEADMVLADVAILEAGQSAEKDGFDAVCVDTMSDSGVAALRSVLSIPVVGPGRASMLTALMLGRRFSILTM